MLTAKNKAEERPYHSNAKNKFTICRRSRTNDGQASFERPRKKREPGVMPGPNEVRLWLSVMAYNLGNLWRRLVLPKKIENWSLTSLQQRLGEDGRTIGETRPILLAAVGREPT
jgi:hypothetical protein